MICMSCRKREHEECPGGTWCDCQHQPSPLTGRAGAEPTLTWIRQG
ncbi:MAG: hypothetical protein WAK82_08675 [Streptosporangiaceae bacterium]